jgi:hypothetical protein
MTGSRFVLFLGALVTISFFVHTGFSLQGDDADEAIKHFLSSQKSETESADSQGSAVADLDRDGKSEIVLVWTLLGPTYWHNTLTVFSRTAGGYKPFASLQLGGEAKLLSVTRGIIVVDEKVFARNDPRCCPSIQKRGKYRLVGKKISEVRR